VKAVTERNPKVVGIVGLVVMTAFVLGILFLNRSVFSSGYTVQARFTNAAGISKGTEVMEAGVNIGTVSSVQVHGNAVDAQLTVNRSVVLPHATSAAVEVETPRRALTEADASEHRRGLWADQDPVGAFLNERDYLSKASPANHLRPNFCAAVRIFVQDGVFVQSPRLWTDARYIAARPTPLPKVARQRERKTVRAELWKKNRGRLSKKNL